MIMREADDFLKMKACAYCSCLFRKCEHPVPIITDTPHPDFAVHRACLPSYLGYLKDKTDIDDNQSGRAFLRKVEQKFIEEFVQLA